MMKKIRFHSKIIISSLPSSNKIFMIHLIARKIIFTKLFIEPLKHKALLINVYVM